jgi:hypothetical protein
MKSSEGLLLCCRVTRGLVQTKGKRILGGLSGARKAFRVSGKDQQGQPHQKRGRRALSLIIAIHHSDSGFVPVNACRNSARSFFSAGVITIGRLTSHPIYPYLLRDVVIDRPNLAWATDITYIPMRRGFVYLVQ